MARTIKVRANVLITIDVDALEAEYGTTHTLASARKDVKDSVTGILMQLLYPETSNIVQDVRLMGERN